MAASDAWLGTAVGAVANGKLADGRPLWDHVVMFITFDEWGGWTDHVLPAVLERIPATDPHFANDPYRYGSRVPCVVVGPYAKAKQVSHGTSSHTSLVAYIERHWGLPPSQPSCTALEHIDPLVDAMLKRCGSFGTYNSTFYHTF